MTAKEGLENEPAAAALRDGGRPERLLHLYGARPGADALYLIRRLREDRTPLVLHIAEDARRMAALEALVRFFAPEVEVLRFPAWDCLPYDRISPRAELMAERIATLMELERTGGGGRLVLATASAVVQRIPPRTALAAVWLTLRPGQRWDREGLAARLEALGYRRVSAVMERGEYALRGGLVDVFPPHLDDPVRIDLFGDTVEALRSFDAASQRSLAPLDAVELRPTSEVVLDASTCRAFASRYLQTFGAVTGDPLLESIQAGRPYPGMEHWLPLFYDRLETLFDALPEGTVVGLDPHASSAMEARLAMAREHFLARRRPDPGVRTFQASPYRPLSPEGLYLAEEEVRERLEAFERFLLSPFRAPPEPAVRGGRAEDLGAEPAREFAVERREGPGRLFTAVVRHIEDERASGKRPLVTASSPGARDRLRKLLADHGLKAGEVVDGWAACRPGTVGFAVLPLEHGFRLGDVSVLTDQDILGERAQQAHRRARRPRGPFIDLSALREGDLVVHLEHGIGRYRGLVTLEVGGAPHDFLELEYAGGDKLLVPVESLDLLTRYGSGEQPAALDRLGGAAWQQRKARIKKRIREIAGELIQVAAKRALRKAPVLEVPEGIYRAFAARFPHEETEDQARAIEEVLADLASGHPMDRLICGDVGFGKTEVAIRAAFVAVMCGQQVALLCPTTLLAHQHAELFRERFRDLPVRIAELSRFTPPRRARAIKEGLRRGEVDIVIGTHALLAPDVAFRSLALLIVDEEQHFGVAHKERLKQLRAEVHVLTMTATPIPRTLHMALGGLKQLSVIATPPVDRLAVRTFLMPADPVVIREAILRERHRGGQTFYVCPQVSDLAPLAADLARLVPEVRLELAHGRLPASRLERVMRAFYRGDIDLLLSTNIIESGLDVPNANTLIVHRADRFGLAQLYQLRGRVGRGKVRAYAYLTWDPRTPVSGAAERRLAALQALEGLGAGFQLAAQDLDIRGAGNLLGEEQSGHIREVGFELYNRMLEEAVADIRARETGKPQAVRAEWSPQITIDVPALLPEDYIMDLDLRLATYRRLAALETEEELDRFKEELADRFGPLPEAARRLLEIVGIKQLARRAQVVRVDAGPKGLLLSFWQDRFPRPEALVRWIGEAGGRIRLRPDHRLVVLEPTRSPEQRLALARKVLAQLADLAEGAKEPLVAGG